jgi:Complex 1 protein (LYR family)
LGLVNNVVVNPRLLQSPHSAGKVQSTRPAENGSSSFSNNNIIPVIVIILSCHQNTWTGNLMARLSGLQREVLSLYRKCLRETRKKPLVGTLPSLFLRLSLMITDSSIGIKKQFQELCQVCLPLSFPSVGALRAETKS